MHDTHQLTTKLGYIRVGINNKDSLYFSSVKDNFVVNGVLYNACGHMIRDNEGWKVTDSFCCVKSNSFKYNDYSTSAKNKAKEIIFNAIKEWLVKAETTVLLHEANKEYIEQRKESIREKIKEKQNELDALNAELNAIV